MTQTIAQICKNAVNSVDRDLIPLFNANSEVILGTQIKINSTKIYSRIGQ